jgi:hypothetical protein
MLDALINCLCTELDLDTVLRPEAGGQYRLSLPDGLNLTLAQMGDGLRLSGIIRELSSANLDGNAPPANATEDLCRELLILSLGRARGECADSFPRLALKGGTLVLEDDLESGLEVREAMRSVERFLNLLEKWTGLAGGKEMRPSSPTFSRSIIWP